LIKKEFFLLVQLIRIKVGVSTFKVVKLNYEDANSQTSPPQTFFEEKLQKLILEKMFLLV
jgi:hypothetical protein